MTLEELNTESPERVTEALLTCCGSAVWAKGMLRQRPFHSPAALHRDADETWSSLAPAEWLEAFSKHPKIGETSASRWSGEEQEGMSQAQQETADAIRTKNLEYERRFGYIFIICATGKAAAEMRASLEQRLVNRPEEELPVAAAEQAKIMHLRLEKLLTT